MATFSATDAALAGFRLMREQPRVVLAWAVFLLAVNIVSTAVVMLTGVGEGLRQLGELQQAGVTDPAALTEAMSRIGPAIPILLAVSLASYAIIFSAGFRLHLHHEVRWGGLRAGKDELRVAAVIVILSLIALAYTFATVFVAALLSNLVGAPPAPLALVMVAAAYLDFFARFGFAIPATLETGRITVLRTTRLVKPNYWRLVGMVVTTMGLCAVVYLLGMVVIVGVLAALAGVLGLGLEGVTQAMSPQVGSLSTYLELGAVWLILSAMLSAARMAIFVGAPAAAYQRLAASADADAFS
jgi:hypothetical protein